MRDEPHSLPFFSPNHSLLRIRTGHVIILDLRYRDSWRRLRFAIRMPTGVQVVAIWGIRPTLRGTRKTDDRHFNSVRAIEYERSAMKEQVKPYSTYPRNKYKPPSGPVAIWLCPMTEANESFKIRPPDKATEEYKRPSLPSSECENVLRRLFAST